MMSKNKRLKMLAVALAAGGLYWGSYGYSSALADGLTASSTSYTQYVAFKDVGKEDLTDQLGKDTNIKRFQFYGNTLTINTQTETLTYQRDNNGYWVREGYVVKVDNNGGKYTDLSSNSSKVDVTWTGNPENKPKDVLESVQSVHSATGAVTNLNQSLNKVEPGSFSGVSNSGGTKVDGGWNFIIQDTDSTWKNQDVHDYKNGYVDLLGGENSLPKGFKTEANGLKWDAATQSYQYKGEAVDYSNLYVINGKVGVFTNGDGSKVYTGNVYGSNNEVLMTVQKDGKLYSYWASQVTDPAATMETYRVDDYKSDLNELAQNDEKLNNNDIKEVRLNKNDDNSATIQLMRNGVNGEAAAVDGAITIKNGGGINGKDTYIQLQSDKNNIIKFNTGSVVTGEGDTALTKLTINGKDYLIQDKDTNTYVESGKVIDKDGKKYLSLTKNDNTTVPDIDLSEIKGTTYKAGNGIEITPENAIGVKEGNGISVDENGVSVNTGNGLTLNNDKVEINAGAGLSINKEGKLVNNLSVANKEGSQKGEWTLTDAYDNKQYTNTVLSSEVSSTEITNGKNGKDKIVYGKDYTVRDTAGNEAILKDVASANKLQEVDGRVTTNTTNIQNLSGKIWTAQADGTDVSPNKGKINFKGTDGIKVTGSNGEIAISGKDVINNNRTDITNIAKDADQHIEAKKYKVDDNGNVTMTYVDGNGKVIEEKTAVISDVASATKLNEVNTQVTTDIQTINATLDGVVKYDYDEATKTYNKNSVTLAGGEKGTQIHNLADGTADHDAVNFSQLKEVAGKEDYVTSGSIENGKITLNRYLGGNVEISGLDTYIEGKDTYVTNATLNGNTLTIERNQGKEPISVDLSNFTSQFSGTDYHLVKNPKTEKGNYTVDSNGKLALTVKDDKTGKTETINIDGIAVVHDNGNLKDTVAKGIWDERGDKNTGKSSSIALGKNTFVSVQDGNKAKRILFGSKTYTGGIAIGENSTALNATVNIGVKDYTGKLGNVDLSTYNVHASSGVGTTSIGSNSYISGTLATNMGAYNMVSTDYMNGNDGFANSNALQNFGSVTIGTLNSIESYGTGKMTSGIANSVIGMANKAQNTNGTLIFGTGNEITNSNGSISTPSTIKDAAGTAESFRDSVQNGKAGGAVLAIGGGNKADNTYSSQMLGVQNTVNNSELAMVNGYRNTVTNSKNVSVVGAHNTVEGDSNKIYGDNHNVEGTNNVILGSADKETSINTSDAVVLGHNANATVDGGVALGANSVADRIAGVMDAYGKTDEDTGSTWISTAGAISVGDSSKGITRQITNVAAGSADTDAVNVSQLKAVAGELSGTDYQLIANPDKDSQGTYKVDKDGNLILKVQDAKNPAEIKDVKLSDIASKTVQDEIDNRTKHIIHYDDDDRTTIENTTFNQDGRFSSKIETLLGTGIIKTDTVQFTTDGFTVSQDYSNGMSLGKSTVGAGKADIGGIIIDGAYGEFNEHNYRTISNLSNTTWDGTTDNESRAASEGQLQTVWNKADEAGKEAQKHTTLTEKDDNINVVTTETEDGHLNYDVSLNKNLNLETVTLKDKDGKETKVSGDGISINNTTTLNTQGLTVAGNTYVSENGLDANNKKILNVAAGTDDTDAVNFSQLKNVQDTVNKGWTVSTNNNKTSSQVKPGDTVDFANSDSNIIVGQNGNNLTFDLNKVIKLGDITIDGTRGSIIGLANVDWTEEIKQKVDGDDEEKSKAATQGQLLILDDFAVKYDKNADGTVNYNSITLGGNSGSKYDSATHKGGTSITNLAYANANKGTEGYNGSAAVNVDLLNDKIDAAKQEVQGNDQHVQAGTYRPDKNGKVNLPIVDNKGNEYGNVNIEDVASKEDLDNLTDTVGAANKEELKDQYKDTNYIKDAGSLVDADKKLDAAIKNNADEIDKINTDITNIKGDQVTGGSINEETGKVTLNKQNGESITLNGQLSDSKLDSGKLDAETGDLTLTSKDKYTGETSDVVVKDVASKSQMEAADKNIQDTIGATSKDDLKEQYKDTTYIKDSSSMVDADKKLDSAITQNRNDIINNSNRIDNLEGRVGDLDSRINKVGAMAVAMAGLHPLGYDPEAPTEFSAAVGNYKGETAMAVGVFHHPNEDVLLNVGFSIAGDETAVNAGATFRFGRRGHNPEEEAEIQARKEAKLAAEKAAAEEARKKTIQYKIQQALSGYDGEKTELDANTDEAQA